MKNMLECIFEDIIMANTTMTKLNVVNIVNTFNSLHLQYKKIGDARQRNKIGEDPNISLLFKYDPILQLHVPRTDNVVPLLNFLRSPKTSTCFSHRQPIAQQKIMSQAVTRNMKTI